MKRLFALILCLMLLIAPLSASAEEIADGVTEVTTVTEEETPAEDEIMPPEDVPEEAPEETPAEEEKNDAETPDWNEVKDTISSKIVAWIYENYDKALVSLFLLMSALYDRVRDKRNRKDIGTLNNNAITIATDGKTFMGKALSEMQNVSGAVTQYDSSITELLAAFKQTAEDKQRLQAELVEIKKYLKTSTDANIEFANELAELLGLANIPNYKKEEIGARHLESVKAILDAEKKAEAVAIPPANTEEVKEDVGDEKKD